MGIELFYKSGPATVLALALLGFALIELMRRPRRQWDLLTLTIVFSGFAGFAYLGSMAIRFTPFLPDPPAWWFNVVRISLWLAAPGIPVIYKNVWLAFHLWHDERTPIARGPVNEAHG